MCIIAKRTMSKRKRERGNKSERVTVREMRGEKKNVYQKGKLRDKWGGGRENGHY